MIRALVLGANGLIGANVIFSLKQYSKNSWNIYAVTRRGVVQYFKKFGVNHLYVTNYFDDFEQLLSISSADIVINCVGVVSQNFSQKKYSDFIKWNSYFSAVLHERCIHHKVRLLNISTDCVFSIQSGDNFEDSDRFAVDLYGSSKRLGEISSQYGHTIRLSSVGFEYSKCKHGLLEWFLGTDKAQVPGFANATYSGTSGSEVFRIIDYVLDHWDEFKLIHFQGYEINKFELLNLFKEVFEKNIIVKESSTPVIKRNLKSRYVSPEDLCLPDWDIQVRELKSMRKFYEN